MLGSCFGSKLLMSLMRDAAVSFRNFNKQSGCCLNISTKLGICILFYIIEKSKVWLVVRKIVNNTKRFIESIFSQFTKKIVN